MSLQKIVISLVVLSVFVLFIMHATQNILCSEEAPQESSTEQGKTTIEIIHQRKSVRKYTDQEVKDEDLLALVKAGMASPSARNKQPWAFFIITETEILNELGSKLASAQMLKTAKAAIVVCGNTNKALKDNYEDYWMIDCAMASQNILLAAESLGLGAVFTAAYPYEDRARVVSEVLNLPSELKPLNVIPIGYPAGDEKPKDKWKTENLYYGRYTK